MGAFEINQWPQSQANLHVIPPPVTLQLVPQHHLGRVHSSLTLKVTESWLKTFTIRSSPVITATLRMRGQAPPPKELCDLQLAPPPPPPPRGQHPPPSSKQTVGPIELPVLTTPRMTVLSRTSPLQLSLNLTSPPFPPPPFPLSPPPSSPISFSRADKWGLSSLWFRSVIGGSHYEGEVTLVAKIDEI